MKTGVNWVQKRKQPLLQRIYYLKLYVIVFFPYNLKNSITSSWNQKNKKTTKEQRGKGTSASEAQNELRRLNASVPYCSQPTCAFFQALCSPTQQSCDRQQKPWQEIAIIYDETITILLYYYDMLTTTGNLYQTLKVLNNHVHFYLSLTDTSFDWRQTY